jgi:hypothetical protein
MMKFEHATIKIELKTEEFQMDSNLQSILNEIDNMFVRNYSLTKYKLSVVERGSGNSND